VPHGFQRFQRREDTVDFVVSTAVVAEAEGGEAVLRGLPKVKELDEARRRRQFDFDQIRARFQHTELNIVDSREK
jgi:hypothetical protein